MELYIMSRRSGVLLDIPIITTNLNVLREKMCSLYQIALAEHKTKNNVDMSSTYIGDDSACVAVGSDWIEWKITAHTL